MVKGEKVKEKRRGNEGVERHTKRIRK